MVPAMEEPQYRLKNPLTIKASATLETSKKCEKPPLSRPKMPDFLNGLFFSEILADNAGGSAVDVNGVGGANKQDEFIEFQNNSNAKIDLAGYQLWSDQIGLLHTFGAGDEIAAGETATVVGTYNNPPAGLYGANGANNSAGQNGGFLRDGEGNKFDTIFLVDPNGNYIQLSYGQNAQSPGALPSGFPTGGTLQGAGETINSGAPNGTSVLRDADGNLTEGTPTPGTSGPICFAAGTLIRTDQGDIAIEELSPGMRILTCDHGLTTLRVIRRAPICRSVSNWNPDIRAVVIPQGVLGNSATLRLSPAHKVLFEGPILEFLFAAPQVLVPAHHLVGRAGIALDMADKPVTYFHLLFDAHELVRSNGCWSESLFLGDVAHNAIQAATGWETKPGLDIDQVIHKEIARPVPKRFETSVLIKVLFDSNGVKRIAA